MHPPHFTSALLRACSTVQHAFFSRQGGCSEGVYASLNGSIFSEDDPAHVVENRRRIADVFALPSSRLCTTRQVHGAQVVTVTTPWPDDTPPHADAMVSNHSDMILGVQTADCAPVLLCDPTARIIGAAHAGWKGAFTGVLENTIGAMEALGATRAHIVAAIGPTIARISYAVDDAYHHARLKDDPDSAHYFSQDTRAQWRFDLPGYVHHRLQRAGIERMDHLAIDTYATAESCFSYRRSTHHGDPDYGRQISAIRLLP